MATLLGIDLLVRQRQQLIESLARKREVGSMEQFSKEIEQVMR